MKKMTSKLLACSLLGLVLLGSNAIPDSSSLAQAQEEQSEAPEKKVRKKPRGRVPNHYGKLGLSPKQKESIYSIQARYEKEIEALQKALEELEQKEADEVHNVLTDDQKESLSKILAEVESRKRNTAQ